MLFRSLTLFTFSLVVGCAAPSADAEDVDTTDQALTPGSLRDRTALDRVRILDADEGAIRVDYAPGHAYESVPFEAVHFAASSDPTVVSVAGDFPSSATVVVTDDAFRVLAVTHTAMLAEGLEEARISVPSGEGGRFVLIRDSMWVRPMEFEVRVGR